MNVISFDLDSTICNTMHRRGIINVEDRAKTDWIAYSMACGLDEEGPAFPMLEMCTEKDLGFIVISRRDNDARELTEKWFYDRGYTPRAMMLLKDEYSSDERRHPEWKVEAVRAYEARTGDNVVLHVDDRLDVTQAMLRNGIPAISIYGEDPGE